MVCIEKTKCTGYGGLFTLEKQRDWNLTLKEILESSRNVACLFYQLCYCAIVRFHCTNF